MIISAYSPRYFNVPISLFSESVDIYLMCQGDHVICFHSVKLLFTGIQVGTATWTARAFVNRKLQQICFPKLLAKLVVARTLCTPCICESTRLITHSGFSLKVNQFNILWLSFLQSIQHLTEAAHTYVDQVDSWLIQFLKGLIRFGSWFKEQWMIF